MYSVVSLFQERHSVPAFNADVEVSNKSKKSLLVHLLNLTRAVRAGSIEADPALLRIKDRP
jgi:hypothetical protein